MAEAKETTAAKKPAAKKASTTTKTTTAAKKPAAASTSASKSATATKTTAKADTKSAAKTSTKTTTAKKAAPAEKSGLLKLHHLKPAEGSKTAKTRVGRGEASKGKTAGRGTKGTKARYQVKVGFEGGQMPLHMRLPKLRGFKNPFRVEYQVLNLNRLEKLFPKGGKVSVEDLILKGAVRNGYPVKILGEGEVTQSFDITVDKFSASAVKKIEAAGGKANVAAQDTTGEK